VKISPLTNHRNTKKGAIKGGFDRITLFKNAEKGFDKLFGYNRQLQETFEYCNTMKNSSITDQLKMQERELNSSKQVITTEKKDTIDTTIRQQISTSANQSSNKSVNQSSDLLGSGLGSVFGISTPEANNANEEQPVKLPKKKKKRQRRIS
jgi:membrane-associated HD superfamily phosphohydrolase